MEQTEALPVLEDTEPLLDPVMPEVRPTVRGRRVRAVSLRQLRRSIRRRRLVVFSLVMMLAMISMLLG